MTMYRQSKEAALIYANSEEELHKIKKEKKLFIILCVTAFIFATLAGIILLGAFDIISISEDDAKPGLSAALASGSSQEEEKLLADGLRRKLLRMHIVANEIVAWLSENMDSASTKEEAMEFINEHRYDLTALANSVLKQYGFNYTAKVSVGTSHFPGKVYGDFYLPAGDYDALKIVLGKGEGHNWWCIAFPALCLFGNADYEDESGERESYPLFKLVLDDEEYEEIKVENVRISFRCKWIENIWPF